MKTLALLLLVLCPSCALLPRPVKSPVPVLEAGKPGGKEMVVFLPGRWSRAEEFQREKFFEMAAAEWPHARLVAPDLHIGYYKNRTLAERVHEDIVLPARKSGVTKLRFVGISMGGLGALIYDAEHPGEVDEMILLSPFVGEDEALREIAAAGGVGAWRPGEIKERDFTRKLWLKLREKHHARRDAPRILLGCGRGDRLAESNRLFARSFLKPGDVLWRDGGHDWQTWRDLFGDLSAR